MKALLILAALMTPTFGHASFGDKIGNGGGLWACKVGNKIIKAQLVDLFEAEREFQRKLIRTKSAQIEKIFEERKNWINENLPEIFAHLNEHLEYVEKSTRIVRATLEGIDDTGSFRSRPPARECPKGSWQYVQFANSNDQGDVLIQEDLWKNPVISNLDKAALLFHEAVYRWRRVAQKDQTSQHSRKITGLFFSNLLAKDMEQSIADIVGDLPVVPGKGVPVARKGFSVEAATQHISSSVHVADNSYGNTIGTTNFLQPCRVDNKGGIKDILCVAEVEELDLYFSGFSFRVNVPAGECTFLKYNPYTFFAYEPGRGPNEVIHEVLADGSIRDVANSKNGTPYCQYNHAENGGPNCCVGNYKHKVITHASDGSTSIATTDNVPWGGNQYSCVAGPIAQRSPSGRPLSHISYVGEKGYNEVISLPAPDRSLYNSNKILSNVALANFYQPDQHQRGKPKSLQPDSYSLYQPQDTYEWVCLNGSEDMESRIRLVIREWNTKHVQEGGNPEVSGQDPDFPTFPISDRMDWADFGDTYPASDL